LPLAVSSSARTKALSGKSIFNKVASSTDDVQKCSKEAGKAIAVRQSIFVFSSTF
jgi:hypothetical protein